MPNKLEQHHLFLPFLLIPICLLLMAFYGYSFMSTIMGNEGVNGDMYVYYRIPFFVWVAYNFLITFFAFMSIISQLNNLAQRNHLQLYKAFIRCSILIATVIVCEIYLQTRFVGKG